MPSVDILLAPYSVLCRYCTDLQVSATLAKEVLTAPGQEVNLVKTNKVGCGSCA